MTRGRYRELRAKERGLHEENHKLQEQLNVMHDRAEEALREYKKLQTSVTELERERARFHGSKETVSRNISNLKTQLLEKQ